MKINKKREKYNISKDLSPDQSSLGMKILRASFVIYWMLNCLNSCYVPLDPTSNFVENRWELVWFKGSHLPHPDDVVDESRKVDESVMAEGSGTINESKIVESVDTDFGDKWKLQWGRTY